MHTHMSTKLEIPVLSGNLNTLNVNAWLNLCQDSFKVHAAVNSSTLKPSIQIVLARIKMEAPAVKSWWNENHEELKTLMTWEEFVKKVKDHFIPGSSKLEDGCTCTVLQHLAGVVVFHGLCCKVAGGL